MITTSAGDVRAGMRQAGLLPKVMGFGDDSPLFGNELYQLERFAECEDAGTFYQTEVPCQVSGEPSTCGEVTLDVSLIDALLAAKDDPGPCVTGEPAAEEELGRGRLNEDFMVAGIAVLLGAAAIGGAFLFRRSRK